MRTRHYIFLILLISAAGSYAQVERSPITMFSMNQTYYNPAANGNLEVLAANFFYRQNWTGWDGTQSTQGFSAHTPFRNPAVAMGILLEHDALGAINNTGLHISYAYRLSLGANKLAFGLRAGMSIVSWDQLDTESEAYDRALNPEDLPLYLPNFGFGLLYYGKKYWAGLSVPWIFNYETDSITGQYALNPDLADYEYFFTGGGYFSFNPNFGLEPSVLFRYCPNLNTPTAAINILGVYKEFYKAGLGFSKGSQHSALSLLLSISLNRQFSLGYSFDFSFGENPLDNMNEINIQYKFGYKVNASNPRGF
jgi:type IX secretion system PorP/SprF family membrane protein